MRSLAHGALVLACFAAACLPDAQSGCPGASSSGNGPPDTALSPERTATAQALPGASNGVPSAAGTEPAVPPPALEPPIHEASCARDEDCAVARIGASGADTCCAICGSIAGSRSWYAKLRLYCGTHPANACPAIDCPVGPSRAVCRAGRCEATSTDSSGKLLPLVLDERRCLPALRCTAWEGCALVRGNDQDGWFVEQAEGMVSGEAVRVGNICTTEAKTCQGVEVRPRGVACAPWSVPPLIAVAPYSCRTEDGVCRKAAP